jgi:hypothetical protein
MFDAILGSCKKPNRLLALQRTQRETALNRRCLVCPVQVVADTFEATVGFVDTLLSRVILASAGQITAALRYSTSQITILTRS